MTATVYAIINQKGGVGKSTTAGVLLAGLTERGFKALAIDLDPQSNLTYATGAAPSAAGAYELLTKEQPAAELIQETPQGYVISGSPQLAGADGFMNEVGKEHQLEEALAPITGKFDYIILDTPPALGVVTVNALTAANQVVIPAQADVFSLQGIAQLAKTIGSVQKYVNNGLKVAGVLLTRYNPRTVLSKDTTELIGQLADQMDTSLFKATIREAVAVKESQINQQSLFKYAPRAKATADYKAFIDELLERKG